MIGAELAVSQHLEDLLSSDAGERLLTELKNSGPPTLANERHSRAVRELAAWLARELVGPLGDLS